MEKIKCEKCGSTIFIQKINEQRKVEVHDKGDSIQTEFVNWFFEYANYVYVCEKCGKKLNM